MSYLAILTASLLGSLHCVGMCGGFATLAGAREDGGQGSGPVFAYHGARVAAYILLGAIAGALGAEVCGGACWAVGGEWEKCVDPLGSACWVQAARAKGSRRRSWRG